jgi:hypothetical protein
MKTPTTALVMSVAAALVYVAALTNSVEGVEPMATDATAGFELESNGFAEEFCARQSEPGFVNTPASRKIPADECNFEAALEEFIGPEGVAESATSRPPSGVQPDHPPVQRLPAA